MRLIKMLGLAAIAAMVTTALVGVTSASATTESVVLCEKPELECENPYPNPIEIHAETLVAEPPKQLTSLGTLECEKSLAIITLLNNLAKLVEGHILSLNFTGNCHLGGTPCEVTVNSLGGFSLTGEAKLTADAKSIALEGRITSSTVKCGSFFNCTLSAGEKTKLTAHSDEAGHLLLLANKTPLVGKGFLCPSTSEADATYHAVNLDAELTLKTGLWLES